MTSIVRGLSRTSDPVREAVADLMKEGLLIPVPRKGFKVRSITESEKKQIIFLRLSIETEGVKSLLQKITPEQISELREIVLKQ